MLAMYLVGSMMGSKKLRKKMGGIMTEGMTAPCRKALEKERISADGRAGKERWA